MLGFRFSGFWTDGHRNGQAKAAYPDGSIFDGFYKDDKRHGVGKVTFSNGDLFEGIFADDLPNGMGKYYHHGFGTYYGNFKKGLRSGSGTEMDAARKEGDPKWRSFDGVFEFSKGDVIVVNWKQGLPHGYGVYVARDVADSVAALVDGQLHVILLALAVISSPTDCSSRAYGKMGEETEKAYCACPRVCQSCQPGLPHRILRIASDPKSPIPRKLQEWVDGVLTVQVMRVLFMPHHVIPANSRQQLELPASKLHGR